jgi:hypothetical protein
MIIGEAIYGGGESGACVFDGVNAFAFATLGGAAASGTGGNGGGGGGSGGGMILSTSRFRSGSAPTATGGIGGGAIGTGVAGVNGQAGHVNIHWA